MPGKLNERACIVTGAGRGIGRSIALAFAAEGARVLVNDVDAAAADQVAKEVTAAGGTAATNDQPIGTVAAAESVLADCLNAFGAVDVLVNNAGILRDKMLHNMSEDDFDQVIQVHLK